MSAELERTLESLLFLSASPSPAAALADASGAELHEVVRRSSACASTTSMSAGGSCVRELAGGYTLDQPSRRRARRPAAAGQAAHAAATAAQAETLAIVAYLQPVSRPEIARIRGVSAESAAATLLERGIIEEAGRSQFGAVLYRTTELFLKLFGLSAIAELPEIEGFDPSPEFEQELRERLLRAGEARSGVSDAGAAVAVGRAADDDD